jgi:hypothetical protein
MSILIANTYSDSDFFSGQNPLWKKNYVPGKKKFATYFYTPQPAWPWWLTSSLSKLRFLRANHHDQYDTHNAMACAFNISTWGFVLDNKQDFVFCLQLSEKIRTTMRTGWVVSRWHYHWRVVSWHTTGYCAFCFCICFFFFLLFF